MSKILFVGILFLASCHIDSAIDQLNQVKKPAIVFSKNEPKNIWDDPQFTVKDAKGELIGIDRSGVTQLTRVYNIGDTIK